MAIIKKIMGFITIHRSPKDGDKGEPGRDGKDGLPGQIPIQKEWVVGDTHRYNESVKDFIYVRGASSNTSYWYTRTEKGDVVAGAAPVGGANKEGYTRVDWMRNLAVMVLLAEEANLANFIFKEEKLISVRGTVDGVETNYSGQANFKPYIILDGKTGKIYAEGAEISGIINAISGTIGSLHLQDNMLVSSSEKLLIDGTNSTIILKDASTDNIRILIKPDNLPTSPSLYFGATTKSASFSAIKGIISVNGNTLSSNHIIVGANESYTFNIPPVTLIAYINVPTQSEPKIAAVSTAELYLTNGSVEVPIGNAFAASTSSSTYETRDIPATTRIIASPGTWRLRLRFTLLNGGFSYGEISGYAQLSSSSSTFSANPIINRSELGANGIVIATDSQNYTYSVGDLFQVRRGSMYFRVTSSGVQKSTDGSNWVTL